MFENQDDLVAYREARAQITSHVVVLEQALDTLQGLMQGADDLEAALSMPRTVDFVQDNHQELSDTVTSLQEHPYLREIADSDPVLERRLYPAFKLAQKVITTPAWQSIATPDKFSEKEETAPDAYMAKTSLPPEPPANITGETTLEYVLSLHCWLQQESQELWGEEDRSLVLPEEMKLPDKYLLGSFEQTHVLVHELMQGSKLRENWDRISSFGVLWNSLNICCSRSKLLFAGRAILRSLLDPQTEPSRPAMLGSIMQAITGLIADDDDGAEPDDDG